MRGETNFLQTRNTPDYMRRVYTMVGGARVDGWCLEVRLSGEVATSRWKRNPDIYNALSSAKFVNDILDLYLFFFFLIYLISKVSYLLFEGI